MISYDLIKNRKETKNLQQLNPESEWYCHDVCKSDKELGERLKKYSEAIDPIKPEVLERWKKLPPDAQECTARRRLYLMKLMVLRAHGIIAADFDTLDNSFNRIGKPDT